MANLFEKAREAEGFLSDGFEFARTVPVEDSLGNSYSGFIKTLTDEHAVPGNNEIVHMLLMLGAEITAEEYARAVPHSVKQ